MVKRKEIKLTALQTDIIRMLGIKMGTTVNQRQLALLLSVSEPAIKKALPLLETLEYITIKKDERLSIALNTNNQYILQLKRADNLKHLYESGFPDFLEQQFAGATIILFGSFSRGEDTVQSDIDIAIIGRKAKQINLETYEKRFERTININFYESFQNIHKRLKENLANGIVLTGGFEL
ncbi:MAG: nucleotidyltransferase domain-containing protein [Candidatus Woesearchaeota archaeon]